MIPKQSISNVHLLSILPTFGNLGNLLTIVLYRLFIVAANLGIITEVRSDTE